MRAQFDYSPEDMEERVSAITLPQPLNQSLGVSRFKDENMSTHRRVLKDLEAYIQESKNKQQQRVKQLKNRQRNMGEEMQKQMAYKQTKRKELEEQLKQKQFQECTFKPKTNQNKGPKRNFTQFLQNQYAHTQKVKSKCNQLKKNIEEKKQKATYKPKINGNSRRRQSQNGTVFERLYSLSEKEKTEASEPVGTFHPSINERSKKMVRQGPVQQMLYGDALRRQEKGQDMILNPIGIEKPEKPVNINNEKYAAQKFIKQYFFTLEELGIDTSFEANIEYVLFNELLKKMGFVVCEEEQQTKTSIAERALVHDAYQVLQKSRVNARNICVFMLGIIGIYNINPVNFEEGEKLDPEKQFNLEEAEGRKMQKHFNLFYRNRLSSEVNRRTEEKSDAYSFQPVTNKQSTELAQRYRNNMLQEANLLLQQCPELQFSIPEDGVISHTDLLVLHKMAKDLKKQKIKSEKAGQELKQCTFKPATISNSLKCSKMSETGANMGYKKSHELYEYFKEVKSKKQSLQASRHHEEDPECTFKPQINKNKPPKDPSVPMTKQIEQTLYRLHKGRQQHEEKQRFFERGEKLKSSKQVKQQQQMPSLILDVNLGQRVDRIVLYRDDESRLSQVAEQFAAKHSLDEESKQKLLEMLKTELENVLAKIEEGNESEDCEY